MKTENLNPPDEPATKTCPECEGAGCFASDLDEPCERCEGTGEIIIDTNNETENNND